MVRAAAQVNTRVRLFGNTGGERGIRTLDTGVSPYNGLANRRLQPLGHLSGFALTTYRMPIAYYPKSIVYPQLTYATQHGRCRASSGNRLRRGHVGKLLRLAPRSLLGIIPAILTTTNVGLERVRYRVSMISKAPNVRFCCFLRGFSSAHQVSSLNDKVTVRGRLAPRYAVSGASVGVPKGSHRWGWLANSRGVHFTYFLNTDAK
jgi:hypothetical protein